MKHLLLHTMQSQNFVWFPTSKLFSKCRWWQLGRTRIAARPVAFCVGNGAACPRSPPLIEGRRSPSKVPHMVACKEQKNVVCCRSAPESCFRRNSWGSLLFVGQWNVNSLIFTEDVLPSPSAVGAGVGSFPWSSDMMMQGFHSRRLD